MEVGLQLVQRLALVQQQIQIGVGLFEPEEQWLTGKPEDLEHLLRNQPQERNGKLHYLVSGGWAVELLTGKKRQHHDLDVIQLSKVPLTYRLDVQKPTSYFGVLSFKPDEILKHYTTTALWDPSVMLGGKKRPIMVYTPTAPFLFVSKVAGFGKEPRERDYEDLTYLSTLINEKSLAAFADLLRHIPFLHPDFTRNADLIRDLQENKGESFFATELGSEYLIEVAKHFKAGDTDFAAKQASRINHTLQHIYEDGLRGAISMGSLGYRPALYERHWKAGTLVGYWVKNGEVDFLAMPIPSNDNVLAIMKFQTEAEAAYGSEFVSIEQLSDRLYKAVLPSKKAAIITGDLSEITVCKEVRSISDMVYKAEAAKGNRDVFYAADGRRLFATKSIKEGNLGSIATALLTRGEFDNYDSLVKELGLSADLVGAAKDYYRSIFLSDPATAKLLEGRLGREAMNDVHLDHYQRLIARDQIKEGVTFANEHKLETRYANVQHYRQLARWGSIKVAKGFAGRVGLTDLATINTTLMTDMIDDNDYRGVIPFAKQPHDSQVVENKIAEVVRDEGLNPFDVWCLVNEFNMYKHVAEIARADIYGGCTVEDTIEKFGLERFQPKTLVQVFTAEDQQDTRKKIGIAVCEYRYQAKDLAATAEVLSAFQLPDSVSRSLFLKDPRTAVRYRENGEFDIPIDTETQETARRLAEYEFGAGVPRENMAWIIGKFNLNPRDLQDNLLRATERGVLRKGDRSPNVLRTRLENMIALGVITQTEYTAYANRLYDAVKSDPQRKHYAAQLKDMLLGTK